MSFYQHRVVRVEEGQAAVDGLVLLHVLFQRETSHQSRKDLREKGKMGIITIYIFVASPKTLTRARHSLFMRLSKLVIHMSE